MKLETAQSFSADPATPADIRYALLNDTQRGEFIILSKSYTCFVQAAGDTEPFFVEYCDDENDRAHRCQSELTAAELEELFVNYLHNKPDWHSGYQWILEPERPWWKFW